MKITKDYLKKLIKEEMKKTLGESSYDDTKWSNLNAQIQDLYSQIDALGNSKEARDKKRELQDKIEQLKSQANKRSGEIANDREKKSVLAPNTDSELSPEQVNKLFDAFSKLKDVMSGLGISGFSDTDSEINERKKV